MHSVVNKKNIKKLIRFYDGQEMFCAKNTFYAFQSSIFQSRSTHLRSMCELEMFLSYYSLTIQRDIKFQPGARTFSATFTNTVDHNPIEYSFSWIFLHYCIPALNLSVEWIYFNYRMHWKITARTPSSDSQITPGISPVKSEELFYC